MGTVHTLPPRPAPEPEDIDVARARMRADLILKLDSAIEKLQVDETDIAAARAMLDAIMPLLGRAVEVLKPHRFVVSLLSAIVNELVKVDDQNGG